MQQKIQIELIKNRSLFFLLLFFFKLLSDSTYLDFLNKEFSIYFDFEVNIFKYFLSLIFIFFFTFFTDYKSENISNFLRFFFLIFFFIPFTSVFSLGNYSTFVFLSVTLSFLIIYINKIKMFKVSINFISFKYLILTSLIIFAVFFYNLLNIGVLEHISFTFPEISNHRTIKGNLINQGPFSYISIWCYKVILPFLLIFYFYKKNYFISIFWIFIFFLLYSLSSVKSVLFYPFFSLSLFLYLKNFKNLHFFLIGIVSLFIINFILYYFLNYHVTYGSYIIRRIFYMPAIITFKYFQYFSLNDFVYWSDSILSFLKTYPYYENTSILIGQKVFNLPASVNNNYISTGYMHAGIMGIIIYSVILMLILNFLDKNLNNKYNFVFVPIMINPFFSLFISSDLLTSLLTHGIILSILICIIINSKIKL